MKNLKTFTSGAEALAFLKNQKETISMVLVGADGSLIKDNSTCNLMDMYYLADFNCYGVYADIDFCSNYQTDSRTASDDEILKRLNQIIEAGFKFIDRKDM